MDKHAEERKVQESYLQYNQYRQQAQGLVQELAALNQTAQNLSMARDVLQNLKKQKESSEILVPVGGNTFLNAKVSDKENVLFGVGADIVIKKPIGEAIQTLSDQLENLKDTGEEMGRQMQAIDEKMRKLEPELQKIAMEAQGHEGHKY